MRPRWLDRPVPTPALVAVVVAAGLAHAAASLACALLDRRRRW